MSFCAHCGTQLPAEARFCPSCGAPRAGEAVTPASPAPGPAQSRSVPAAPPAGETVSVHPASGDIVLASIGRRAFAHIIDFIPVAVIYGIVGSIVATRTGGMTENGFEMKDGPALVAIAITYLVVLFYFTVFEALPAGKTFGKMLVGIRVADVSGGKASFGQAFMRNLLRLIDGLLLYLVGLILALNSKRKQRLGDQVAHTIVLRTTKVAKAEPADRTKAKVRFSMGSNDPTSYLDQ